MLESFRFKFKYLLILCFVFKSMDCVEDRSVLLSIGSIKVGDVVVRDVELFLFLGAQEGSVKELPHLPWLTLDNDVPRVHLHASLHVCRLTVSAVEIPTHNEPDASVLIWPD